jgi:hypothetical protein
MDWLHKQEGFETITETQLLVRHRGNLKRQPTDDDPNPEYEIPSLLKAYLGTINGRYKTKLTKWATVRSFFKYNLAPLPQDPTLKIRSDTPPVKSNLTIDHVRRIVAAARLREKSWLLVKWQSLCDTRALDHINRNLAGHIVSEIRAGKTIIRLDLHGRKGSKNQPRGEFYTFMGKDAIGALAEYFEKERGWPKPGEAIWLNKFGKPHEYVMYGDIYLKLLRMQGLIGEANGDQSSRSGMSPHEFRDCAKIYLHTNAKAHGLDIDCVDFWMGHESRDPNAYDKFMDDENYVLEQYKIAEPHLNIISQPATLALQEQTQKLESQAEKIKELEFQMEIVNEAVKSLGQWSVALEAGAPEAAKRLRKKMASRVPA